MNVTVLLVHVVDRFSFVGESAGVLCQHLRNANASQVYLEQTGRGVNVIICWRHLLRRAAGRLFAVSAPTTGGESYE